MSDKKGGLGEKVMIAWIFASLHEAKDLYSHWSSQNWIFSIPVFAGTILQTAQGAWYSLYLSSKFYRRKPKQDQLRQYYSGWQLVGKSNRPHS
jgi:hypothetical protein